jgi:hypothetical protein
LNSVILKREKNMENNSHREKIVENIYHLKIEAENSTPGTAPSLDFEFECFEMYRFCKAFLSREATFVSLLRSIYSTSILFVESLVDILSSIDSKSPSDLQLLG